MLPENSDAPENAIFICYEDPISREDFLAKYDEDRKQKIEDTKFNIQQDIEWAEGIRWLYVRADDVIQSVIAKRKGDLGPIKSSQDKTINELEEVRAILASLARLSSDLKLLDN